MRKFGKNLVIFTRLALFCAGLAAGVLIAWRITGIRKTPTEYGIIVYVVTGLVLGLAFMLSASSLLNLGYDIAGGVKSAVKKTRMTDVAAAIIGILVGSAIACLFDFLISLGLKIFSLRVVLDLVFAILASWGFAVAASKVFRVFSDDRIQSEESCAECRHDAGLGYVLHASALGVDGVVEFCSQWLLTKPIVLDSTVSEITGGGKENEKAASAYRELVSVGGVVTVSGGSVADYAIKHGLRVIAAHENSLGEDPGVCVLGLGELAEKIIKNEELRMEN